LGGGFLGGGETIAVQFQEEDADEEAGAFVAVDEGMVADDADGVYGSHIYNIRVLAIGVQLPRAGQSGLKQAQIADTWSAAVQGEETAVECESVALVDPHWLTARRNRLVHVTGPINSLREGMQGVAVAADDVLRLFHFLCEGGIIGCELIGAVWAFDQEKAIAFAGLEAADGFLGENDA
jgi:hypothetical protein